MILVVGRTGSGKDTYAKYLEELGLKGICSYTTRPRRENEGDTHIFIDELEVEKYPNKIAITKINGYTYFATKEQFEESDFYIIDPNGIDYLHTKYPDLTYKIVYIYADYSVRKDRAINRVNIDKEKEKEIFIQRNKSEENQFSVFENSILYNKNIIIHNNTNLTKAELQEYAKNDI